MDLSARPELLPLGSTSLFLLLSPYFLLPALGVYNSLILQPIPGSGQVICREPDTGVLVAGSDPRRDGYAVGW
jgi:hypothetical protein